MTPLRRLAGFPLILALVMSSRLVVRESTWLRWRRRGREARYSDAHPLRLRLIHGGELLLKLFQLGEIVEDDIRVIRVAREEILVIGLGGIKPFQRHDLGNDRRPENVGFVEMGDVRQRRVSE